MTDLLALTALEAHEAMAAGALDAGEYAEAWRAAAATDELNAYLWRAEDGGGEAIAVERPSIAPVAVKDIFCAEGVPTTAGSRILEGYRPPYTATAVRKLVEAGAPILGKTNMDEFAMGSSNENSAYGPVLNPWDRGRVPGGSSGGSAAVVAGGLAPWAIGTDTGGSIRQPASLCGIVGLKPTYGAISRYGMIAFASSLDQCGPLTRDGQRRRPAAGDPAGPGPLRLDLGRAAQRRGSPPRGPHGPALRQFPPSSPATRSSPACARSSRRHWRRIERLGGVLTEVPLPHAEHGISAYYVIAPAEASSNLARYDGVRYGMRAAKWAAM